MSGFIPFPGFVVRLGPVSGNLLVAYRALRFRKVAVYIFMDEFFPPDRKIYCAERKETVVFVKYSRGFHG